MRNKKSLPKATFFVGVVRLELTTTCTPCKYASQLRHTPNNYFYLKNFHFQIDDELTTIRQPADTLANLVTGDETTPRTLVTAKLKTISGDFQILE